MQPSDMTTQEQRDILPDTTRPVHYNLAIKPDFQSFKFDGRVIIQLMVNQNSDATIIQMNAKDLKVKNVKLESYGQSYPISKVSLDESKDILTFELEKPLAKGSKATLSIDYEGEMNDKMAGFYRSSYMNESNTQKKYLGVTQFEATDARRAFPCWDEPAVKAKFTITLIVPKELTALSNMEEESKLESSDGLVTIRFRESPIMSTYLVAWVIGDLEFLEKYNESGTRVRIYATKGNGKLGSFALDVGTRTLDYFTKYFDIPYPLKKMDMVAIPDFSAGAMENWGLVTYRTNALLYDEENSSLAAKQRVASVVAHELAHQWFGNLVTMDWWSGLWLNEGFATYVSYVAVDHLFPEWDIWTEFVVDDCQAGLELDGMRSSHPIEVPVKNPDEIGQIFDSISYSKGASVIRMLVKFLGEATFLKGLRAYLEKHKYSNVETNDLWTALSEASGQPVNSIMNIWTRKVGYPVLDVKTEKTANSLELFITQHRFLSSIRPELRESEDKVIWSIPLQLGTDKDPIPKRHLSDDLVNQKSSVISLASNIEFFKLNMQQAGFYRVNYPVEWLGRLGKAIENGLLAASDRIGIISDAFSLNMAGKLSISAVLELLTHFHGEDDYLVWSQMSSRLNRVLEVWWEQPEDIKSSLKSFILNLYQRQVDRLGFEFQSDESDKIKLLRPLVLGISGKCGNVEVIKEFQSRFRRYLDGDTRAIHPNMRSVIYASVVRNGGREEYESILQLYQKHTIADQKLAALGALGASKDAQVIKSCLELSLKEDIVRAQDIIYIYRSSSLNENARRSLWKFTKDNWQFFRNRYAVGGGISLLGRIVDNSASGFTSEEDAKDFEQFFSENSLPSIARSIEQTLERIRSNKDWLEYSKEDAAKWLKSHVLAK